MNKRTDLSQVTETEDLRGSIPGGGGDTYTASQGVLMALNFQLGQKKQIVTVIKEGVMNLWIRLVTMFG
ncbi:hypothetical protein P4S72_28655 [Vibrio sp. PP-XX7]